MHLIQFGVKRERGEDRGQRDKRWQGRKKVALLYGNRISGKMTEPLSSHEGILTGAGGSTCGVGRRQPEHLSADPLSSLPLISRWARSGACVPYGLESPFTAQTGRRDGDRSRPGSQLPSCLYLLNTLLALGPFTSCFLSPPGSVPCWKAGARHRAGT